MVVVYLASPGGSSMVDAGGENFVFWFSRTEENAILDMFSKNFAFVPRIFLLSRKEEGAWPPRPAGP